MLESLLINIFFVTAIVGTNSVAVEFGEILRCKSYGEPHISTWHSDSNLSPTLTTCIGNQDLKYVQNKYIDMDVNIRNGYNVGFTTGFYDINGKFICSVIGNEFGINIDPNCDAPEIIATLIKTSDGQTLTVKHTTANLLVIVVQIENTLHQFTIQLFQTESLTQQSIGQCSKTSCQLIRSLQSEPQEIQTRNLIDDQESRDICTVYLKNYLDTTYRTSSERSLYFNASVEQSFRDCTYDVKVTGQSSAAAKTFEILLLEDLIDNVKHIDQLEHQFNAGIRRALNDFSRSNTKSYLINRLRHPHLHW